MKRVVILGSTGSIGRNALRVVAALPSRLQVVGLSANRDYRLLLQQAERFKVRHVAVADPAAARRCATCAPRDVVVRAGVQGLVELAQLEGVDLVLCAVMGMVGLRPVLAAINCGRDVALATKEVLVAAGQIVTRACARRSVRILPVDSEPSAILQCLNGRGREPETTPQRQSPRAKTKQARGGGVATVSSDVRRILLTASGGPFASRPRVNLDKVTVKEALSHPKWIMGRKITVDSATLMNKGLEIIEARWLFGLALEQIEVVIHPESIVHSLVEFADGSLLAQLSAPDMRFAIQYALLYPERVATCLPALDLSQLGTLHFAEPDLRRFPSLNLAREAARLGGTAPAVLSAANEVAVERFLEERIRFSQIWKIVAAVLDKHRVNREPTLEELIEADKWARRAAAEMA